MTSQRLFGSVLCLTLACLSMLSGAPPHAGAQASASGKSPLDVATSWVYALKRGDARVLDQTSAYPFELRVQNPPCQCEGGKARDRSELTQLFSELIKTEAVKALEVTSADAKEVPKEHLPDWAKQWGKRLPKGMRLVQVDSTGDGHPLACVLVIKDEQVRAAWLNAGG